MYGTQYEARDVRSILKNGKWHQRVLGDEFLAEDKYGGQ